MKFAEFLIPVNRYLSCPLRRNLTIETHACCWRRLCGSKHFLLILFQWRESRCFLMLAVKQFLFIVPCILISIKFIHQQMHIILNLIKF